MDSLDDILNRVLQNASEKVAQRIQPAMNRRPLQDPQSNARGFMQDISTAVSNIRSPDVINALRSQAPIRGALVDQQPAGDMGSNGPDNGTGSSELPSSSAVNQRRTTVGDDAQAMGTLIPVVGTIIKHVATAGKAIGDFSGNATKLDKAVTGMAQTVVSADKDVKAAKPAEGFTGWLRSFIGSGKNNQGDENQNQNRTPESAGEIIGGLNTGRSVANRAAVGNNIPVANAPAIDVPESQQQTSESASVFRSFTESVKGLLSGLTEQRRDSFSIRPNPAVERQQMAGAYQWGSYPKKDGFGMASPSPADNAAGAERPESRVNQWLNSSSLADGFRNLISRITPQRAQFMGGGSPAGSAAGSAAGSVAAPSPGGFVQDANSIADRAAARAMNLFRRMSRVEDTENEDVNEPWRPPSVFTSIRQSATRAIGRTGRRVMNGSFRNRVRRGQNLIRGRVQVMPAGGGAGGAPPVANTSLGFPRGMFNGGASGGSGAGSGAGGAGGSGAGGAGGAGAGAGANAGGGAAGGGGSGGFFGRMAGMFGGGGAGAGGAAGGGAAGGGGGAAAGGAGLAAGAVALGLVALAAVVVVAVGALAKLGMQGYETALRVAQFDGQLSAAKAQLDVSRLMRDIGTARTLSESGAGFMKALNKLEMALRPITDGALNVGLVFLTEVVLALTEAFRLLLKATVMYVNFLDWINFGAIPNEWIQRLDDMANGRQQNAPQNIPAAGFHDMFRNLPPAAPPRPPLPPLGGP